MLLDLCGARHAGPDGENSRGFREFQGEKMKPAAGGPEGPGRPGVPKIPGYYGEAIIGLTKTVGWPHD